MNSPKPFFTLRWDEEGRNWRSEFVTMDELPEEIRRVFEDFGYGCLAEETNIGVVHVCHAALWHTPAVVRRRRRTAQASFAGPPTAPLIRLQLTILDDPGNLYRFESFLNVAEEDRARVLAQLAGQDRLYLAFYGDDLSHPRRSSCGVSSEEEVEGGAAYHASFSGGTRVSMNAISRGRSLCTGSYTTLRSTRKYS